MIAAELGPIRARPAKNATIGTAVETSVMRPIQSQPSSVICWPSVPLTAAASARVHAAPAQTSAVSAIGSRVSPARSATRMYAA